MVVVAGTTAGAGTTVVAGYTAANKLDQLALYGIISVGNASSTFAGQNIGAGKPERVKEGVRCAWIIGAVVCLVFGIILFFFGGFAVQLFVSGKETETIRVAVGFFKIVSPFYIIGCGMRIYMDTMRGMGEVVIPMAGSLTELAGKVAAAFVLSMAAGYEKLWFAWPIGWIAAFILLAVYYYCFLWKKRAAKNP